MAKRAKYCIQYEMIPTVTSQTRHWCTAAALMQGGKKLTGAATGARRCGSDIRHLGRRGLAKL
jgi:hypothetical protein